MNAERSREREVHRYYQTWLETSTGLDTPASAPTPFRRSSNTPRPHSSEDKALTAFAQLGCLRLNAKRGLVTLISSSRQYILAEATRTLSLISGLAEDAEDDELWFGNASVPRSQAVSPDALDPPDYTAVSATGKTYTAKALIVNDLTKHEKYSKNAYAGSGVTFYCGVPIITRSGHAIGVYTVTDDKPRAGLTPAELIFMRDMSIVIMQHLDTVKNDVARFRGEKMVLGLSHFLQGRSSTPHRHHDNALATHKLADGSDEEPPCDQQGPIRSFKGLTITNADPAGLKHAQGLPDGLLSTSPSSLNPQDSITDTDAMLPRPSSAPSTKRVDLVSSSQRSGSTNKSSNSTYKTLEQVFSRAATILRDCAAADGVVFFDATPAGRTVRSRRADFLRRRHQSEDDSESSENSTIDSQDSSSGSRGTNSDSLLDRHPRGSRTKSQRCHVLGSAFDRSFGSTTNVDDIDSLCLNERSLRRLIRRYPRGKTFFFNESSSTSEGDASDRPSVQIPEGPTEDESETTAPQGIKMYSSAAIAQELIRVIPGARNVIWLPMWDFQKRRWCAGMFLWSQGSDKLLAIQDDMAYFKTFANSVMTEVIRVNSQLSDAATSTFVANISHELRSPLHGILGSVEFLKETSLDTFQSSMAFGVETCAKTLLDVVEHVLDYAKINQTSAKFSKRSKSSNVDSTSFESSLEEEFDLAQVFEEAVEVVYAKGIFRTPQNLRAASIMGAKTAASSNDAQVIRDHVQHESDRTSRVVRTSLNIEKHPSWWVRSQPGGIRRIIMNILGNAIKYTDEGQISVSLTMSRKNVEDSDVRKICMTVKDTGRGMSTNFLRDNAFTPFSQESQLSEGVGLGLSIVRQIAHSLNGYVDLKSTEGVGTEISVTLPLEFTAQPAQTGPETLLSEVTKQTSGLQMCMLDPDTAKSSSTSKNVAYNELYRESICDLVQTWYDMKAFRAVSMNDKMAPDFFIYTEPPSIDHLMNHHGPQSDKSEVPLIIVTTDAFESASLAADGINQLIEAGRVLEVISQPCGPRKLAKALHRCFERLHATEQEQNNLLKPTNSSVVGKSTEKTSADTTTNDHDINEAQVAHEQPFTQASDPEPDPLGSHSDEKDKCNPLVLLVEDNKINLNLLIAFMKKAQLPYVTAENGQQAVDTYKKYSTNQESPIHHILMDISMPIMNGIEATQLIRRHEKSTTVQQPATIIALTALSAETTRKDMMDAGADYFLSKPIKFKNLMQLLHSD